MFTTRMKNSLASLQNDHPDPALVKAIFLEDSQWHVTKKMPVVRVSPLYCVHELIFSS